MKKRILVIITGSIAAYKVLDLLRLLGQEEYEIATILTRGGAEFVTPLSIGALSKAPVYQDVFSLKDETEMGHIRLARDYDLVLIAPASADILGKMAHGLADDLASTVLLATDKPVIAVPAMNTVMWNHKAVQRNVAQLKQDGVTFLGPEQGKLACGEEGDGRMMVAEDICTSIKKLF